jgi:hypothetical protein
LLDDGIFFKHLVFAVIAFLSYIRE